MTAKNDFTWWASALAGNRLPNDGNTPECGFYKVKRKGHGGYFPIAYWHDSHDGAFRCQLGGKEYDEQIAREIWPYASKEPVSREAYAAKVRTGLWPGEHPAVAAGHNNPPAEGSLDAIAGRIDDLAREAEKMIATGAVTSDAIADQASDLANALGELEGKAEDARVAEKAPHLEAGRAVDLKWVPTRDKAKNLKSRLKQWITPWLRQKADAVRAEAARVAAEAAAKGEAPRPAEPTRITAGESKRSTALRTYTYAQVNDWPALIGSLAENGEIRAVAQDIANAWAKQGTALPGTEIRKEERAA